MAKAGRKLLDRTFTGISVFAVVLMAVALLVILLPIFVRGIGAFYFRGTVEFRRMQLEEYEVGDREAVQAEVELANEARQPVFDMIESFEKELEDDFMRRLKYREQLEEMKDELQDVLGPAPDVKRPPLLRKAYGATRWDRTEAELHELLYLEQYDYSDPTKMGTKYYEPRAKDFEGTSLEPMFGYIEEHIEEMMLPQRTFYWRFLTQESKDAHFFGGIWPEVLGTLYLTLGAMLFAVPMGVIAAIYLVEYAGDNMAVSLLRSCISTLAGVPSIVFGLFGLAFFINTLHIPKSVLAGSLTLGLLVLPTVIRASEEALRSVPQTYKEAALSLGASRWRTVLTVLLPAALPGILTGVVLSMGRAAGETAPIIFTAAVSVGLPLKLWQTLSQPTPALSWNVYNLCTEHEAVEQIRHVQFGMVTTLVLLVLLLNAAALILRARISKKLRG